MKKSDIETHNEGNTYSKQRPAINVKQHHFVDPNKVIEKFGCDAPTAERALTFANDSAREIFWQDAQDIVREILREKDIKVYSAGRSGGWLIVVGLPDIESWDAIRVSRWGTLCRAVERQIKYITSDEYVLEDIEANRWSEEFSEKFNFIEKENGETVTLSELKKQAIDAGFGAVVR